MGEEDRSFSRKRSVAFGTKPHDLMGGLRDVDV
jgi:hypothetical protein